MNVLEKLQYAFRGAIAAAVFIMIWTGGLS